MRTSGRRVLLACVGLAACATSPQASGFAGQTEARAAIMEADLAFSRAAQERRAAGWAEYFADSTMWPIRLAPAGSSLAATRE